MRRSRWLIAFLLCLVLTAKIPASATSTSFKRIGRGTIQAVEWHPSGHYILASTITGAWLYTPDLRDLAHIPDIQLSTLSPDGRFIAGIDDVTHQVRLWDANTFQSLTSPDLRSFRQVLALAWSPNGRFLAVLGTQDILRLSVFDFFNNHEVLLFPLTTGDHLIWSPDSKYLAVGYRQPEKIFIYGIDATIVGAKIAVSPATEIGSTVVWQDATHILVINYDDFGLSHAVQWNITSGQHLGDVTWPTPSIVYSHDGDSLAFGKFYGGVVVLDSGTFVHRLEITVASEADETNILAWSHNDRWLAAGTFSYDQSISAEVWLIEPSTGHFIRRLHGAQQAIRFLAWNPTDRYLLAVDAHQQMFMYDVVTGETVAYNKTHTLVGDTVAWNSKATILAIADSLGNIMLWDAEEQRALYTLLQHQAPIIDIKWQPDGTLIAAQGSISPLPNHKFTAPFYVWDTSTTSIPKLSLPSELSANQPISFFAWHPDGQQLAILANGTPYQWNPRTGSIKTHPRPDFWSFLQNMIWSPSGTYLAFLSLGYDASGSWVYSVASESYVFSSAEVGHGIAVWSPDDELISLRWGSWGDSTPPQYVSPWLSRLTAPNFRGIANQQFKLDGLTHYTQQGFLSPQGSYAAAIDDRGSGIVWDAKTAAPLAMLSDVMQVVWSGDEHRVAILRTDGSIWALDAAGVVRQQLTMAAILQPATGTLYWSANHLHLAYLHDGVIDLWRFVD